jgi:hypothetical protein
MIKTAGTTLHYIFRNNYGFRYAEINKPSFNQRDLRVLKFAGGGVKAIGGHGLRPDDGLRAVDNDIFFLTFIRNPVARFISHYNHGLKAGSHDDSLEKRCSIVGEHDYQTKFLLGCKSLEERSFAAGAAELEKAKKILQTEFQFVGVVERFDESLLLMRHALGLPNFEIRYQPKNVKPDSAAKTLSLSEKDYAAVRQANQTDTQLYQFAEQEIFNRHRAQYGISRLLNEAERLDKACQAYRFSQARINAFRMGKYLVYRPLFKWRAIWQNKHTRLYEPAEK